MIPTVVAAEVVQALRDFLITGFKPFNPELASVIEYFDVRLPDVIRDLPQLEVQRALGGRPAIETVPPVEYVRRLRDYPGGSSVPSRSTAR